jgi:lycopene beta-cyclase
MCMTSNSSKSGSSEYDYIIIGAGGAGMCLLLALHNAGLLEFKKVLVLEPDLKNTNDRTWCFWAQESDAIVKQLQPILHNKWDYLDVTGQKKDIAPYSYYYFSSLNFYTLVKEKIKNCPNVEWLQQSVKSISRQKDANKVLVEEDRAYTGCFVFSSLIGEAHKDILGEKNRILWQSFYGLTVKFKSDCLPDDAIKLMDFSIDQDGQCQFIYLLPFAKDKALVELTRFGKKVITEAEAPEFLHEWITQKYADYDVLEIEAGKIPMTSMFNPKEPFYAPQEQVIAIGTAAGSVKCSTGYAFYTMFDHACRIAEALKQSKPIPKPYRQPRFSFYDNLLLILLHEKPYLGKLIFESLFNNVRAATILKFLQEKTSLAEEFTILKSLPIPPFLWSLFNRTKFNRKYNGKV